VSLGDVMAVACADAFRGDGRIMASPMGPMPRLGARLAKATFEPGLVLTDGVATIVDLEGNPRGAMPFSRVFDTLWAGRRHVMMGATQIDQRGNQNISCIGDFAKPKVQLLGARGAPGNTINHPTSYFVGRHSAKVFVPNVDFISGVGTDHGAHEIRVVVTNLGVFDFLGPDGTMQVRSLHAGVSASAVQEATGFAVHVPEGVSVSREPTADEAAWLDRLDPDRAARGPA
jgi:acyl CoA:acetate/3-ketoacid CoA transferase beta subunit